MMSLKLVRVNLSDKKVRVERVNKNVLENWIGGRGLGIYYFLKEVNPKVYPLSEENKIGFFVGFLTGVLGLPSSRVVSITKSPLNNRLHRSVGGGRFGYFMRFLNMIGIIIEGKSEDPVYLYIDDENIEIKDASNLWGLNVKESYSYLAKWLKNNGFSENDFSIALIGKAGENMVYYSSIILDLNSAMGRGGHGAILGYKKLKAIVLASKNKIVKVYDETGLREYLVTLIKRIRENSVIRDLTKKGTLGMLLERINKRKKLPYHNVSEKIIKELLENYLRGIDLKESSKVKCHNCIIACKKYLNLDNYKGHSPEYWGGFVSLGNALGIYDINKISKLFDVCNDYGLDAISLGYVITYFIELVKKGIISYNIGYGDFDKILILIEDIVEKRGIGNELSRGVKNLLEKYGKIDKVVVVRGLENSLVDFRNLKGFTTSLVTSNQGDQRQVSLKEEVLLDKPIELKDPFEIAKFAYDKQNLYLLADSSVICLFSIYELSYEEFSKLLYYSSGIDFKNIKDKLNLIYSAERYFNILAGNKENDLEILKKLSIDFVNEEVINEYYKLRNWENGEPREDIINKIRNLISADQSLH